MSDIKFKSVGRTAKKIIETAITGSVLPIGFKTPLRLGNNSEGIFAMNTDLRLQIADNLRNLLLTNHGERLMFGDLGANLRPLVFEAVNAGFDFEDEAVVRIKDAVEKYMPFINLSTFKTNIEQHENIHTGKVKVTITYDIPALQVTEEEIAVTLHIV